MGFLDKFRKSKDTPGKSRPGERDEMENRGVKETIANAALSTLKAGEDYNDLAGLTVNFGYLYSIDGHGMEGMFKITTDKGTLYFAAQKDRVMRLDFTEELYNTFTESFLADRR